MKKILEEVRDAKSIAISGHIRPDGDCVGSCMGMYLFLKKELPDTQVHVFLEKPSDVFNCICGVEEIKVAEEQDETVYDVFIALDCSKDRLGGAEKLFDKAVKKINIDHHISNTGCGDVNYLRADASSASELVFELLEEDRLDMEIAKALYIGIIHDTGVFQYSNTLPATLQVAAKLVAFGFNFKVKSLNAAVSDSEKGYSPIKFSSAATRIFFSPNPQHASKLTFKSTPLPFAL